MRQIDEFIHSVYGAVLDSSKWEFALAQLAAMAEAPKAALLDSDLAAGVTHRLVYFGMGEAENRRYLTDYAAIDPRMPAGLAHYKLIWLSDFELFDDDVRKKERIYTELLIPGGVGESLFAMFAREGVRLGSALLARALTQPKAPSSIREVLDQVLPHLDRAIRISRRFETLAIELILSHNVLDALTEPLACVLADGRLHRANQAFEDILRTDQLIFVKDSLLCLDDAKLQGRLSRAIQECCRLAEGGGSNDPDVELILRVDHPIMGSTFITLAPLGAAHLKSWAGKPCALVRIDRPGGEHDVSNIAEALGITTAESRLVSALCLGGKLSEAAQRIGVSLNTAKTHLASVFSKTATARQSELIALVSALPKKR